MKKNIFSAHTLLLIPLIITIIISCSKERVITPTKENELLPTSNMIIGDPDSRIGYWGSITGVIFPAGTDAAICVFNRSFKTADFYYVKGGTFRVDRIPPGVYDVRFVYTRLAESPDDTGPQSSELTEHLVSTVRVTAGKVTDIGIIKLP